MAPDDTVVQVIADLAEWLVGFYKPDGVSSWLQTFVDIDAAQRRTLLLRAHIHPLDPPC